MRSPKWPRSITRSSLRSIESDDRQGVQALYGAKAADKPRIDGVAVIDGEVRIAGHDFDTDLRSPRLDGFETRRGLGSKGTDSNFDGRLDTWSSYENGTLVTRLRDTNLNGDVDVWISFYVALPVRINDGRSVSQR